ADAIESADPDGKGVAYRLDAERALVGDRNAHGALPHFDADAVGDAAIAAANVRHAIHVRGHVAVDTERGDPLVHAAARGGSERLIRDRMPGGVAHDDAQRQLGPDGVETHDRGGELEPRSPLVYEDERGRGVASRDRPQLRVTRTTRGDDSSRGHRGDG